MAGTLTKQERIRDRVLDLIGALRVGDSIPSERELSRQLGVSRMTLRRAVDELVKEGYLVRRHGSGTYVARPKPNRRPGIASFSAEVRGSGMVPSSRTLSATMIPAGAELGRRLHISPSQTVHLFHRLRLADGIPAALETLHVPEELCPGLTGSDLEAGSFYELLAERYGLEVTHGTQTIEPTVINAEECELLEVPLHSPAFLFELTTRVADGRPVEFVRSVHRGDRYKLQVDLGGATNGNSRLRLDQTEDYRF